MSHTDHLDRRAAAVAQQYMGNVAWPTIILAFAVGALYVGTVGVALTGLISLWIAAPLVAVLTYLSYTVLHESVHGSITGNRQSLRWLNKALGYMAAWIVMIPLTAHRHEHIAHHRYANDEAADPDYHVGKMQNSILAAVRAALQAWIAQFSYYGEQRWKDGPPRQNLVFCLEVLVMFAPRLLVFAAGYWVVGLALFVVAWLIAAVVLLYLFAYVVHRPQEQTGRYVDTSTILLPGLRGTLLSWFWMFQNYHSIHHLFPRVPFYQYPKVFAGIEDIMVAKGAPIYRMTARGLQRSDTKLTA